MSESVVGSEICPSSACSPLPRWPGGGHAPTPLPIASPALTPTPPLALRPSLNFVIVLRIHGDLHLDLSIRQLLKLKAAVMLPPAPLAGGSKLHSTLLHLRFSPLLIELFLGGGFGREQRLEEGLSVIKDCFDSDDSEGMRCALCTQRCLLSGPGGSCSTRARQLEWKAVRDQTVDEVCCLFSECKFDHAIPGIEENGTDGKDAVRPD